MGETKLGLVQKYRSFPFGEGEGGWGLMNKEQNAQECESSTGRFEGNESLIVVLKVG